MSDILKKSPAPTWDGPNSKPNASQSVEIKIPALSFRLPSGFIVYGAATLGYNPRQWMVTEDSFTDLVRLSYDEKLDPEQFADNLMRELNEEIEPWAAQLQVSVNIRGQQMMITARCTHEDLEQGPRIQTAGGAPH